MKKYLQTGFLLFVSLVLACALMGITANAKEVLPDNFIVVDSNGIYADRETPYFVHIENMQVGKLYEETIFLQNLETDSYTLYLRTQPVDSAGDVDLFEYSRIQLYLDGTLLYEGSPNGLGNIDMQQETVEIGNFEMGETKILKLNAEIPESDWPGSEEGASIRFDWIFTAQRTPGDLRTKAPHTDDIITTILLTILALLLAAILLILIYCWRILRGNKHYIVIQQQDDSARKGGQNEAK